MAEDQGNQEEEKFDFTGEGEAVDYISLEQARVLAIRHARDNPDFYGASYSGINLVWEAISLEEGEDYYDIKLSFRPAGRFRGDPGIEQFTIDKTGNIEIRQMLDEPTGVDETIESEIESRQISDEPSDMGEPESLANQSVAENSAGVAEVRVLHPAETPSTPTVTKPIETTISKPIITPLKISIRTPRYEFLQQWGPDGGDAGQLRGPVGIAVDENRVAYVTEWDNNRVHSTAPLGS